LEELHIDFCFIDTNIIIDAILNLSDYRIMKFFRDIENNKINCYITKTVKEESEVKIEETLNYFGNVLKEYSEKSLLYIFEQEGLNEDSTITTRSILLLEKFFNTIYAQRNVLKGPVRILEDMLIKFIEAKLQSNIDITIKLIIERLISELLKFSVSLRNKYDDFFIRPYVIVPDEDPDQRIIDDIRDKIRRFPKDDAKHLSIIYQYFLKINKNMIFVTRDNGILKYRDELLEHFNIICSDPLYAIYHCLHGY